MMGHATTVSAYSDPVVSGPDLSGTTVSRAVDGVLETYVALAAVCEAQQRAIASEYASLQQNRARLEHLRVVAAQLQQLATRKPRRRRVAA